MKIVEFPDSSAHEIRYLNAGRGPGQFYEDRLPIHLAKVDRLPDDVSALVVTGDLQGRERFQDTPAESDGPRLLGEALPKRLVEEVFPLLQIAATDGVGVLLAGDFYTVPALDKRGGSGDVTSVWHAFAECFDWVVGVPGNHDLFGDRPEQRPRFPSYMQFLDGDVAHVGGLRIAGLGGIIGNSRKPHRRSEEDYLDALQSLLDQRPDVLLTHDGPDGTEQAQRGMSRVREMLLEAGAGLVVRGHAHWKQPLAEYTSGLQVLNVDARVVILRRS